MRRRSYERPSFAFAEAAFFAARFFLLRVVSSFSRSLRFSKRCFVLAVIAGISKPIPAKRIVFSYSSDMLHTRVIE